MVKIVNGYAEKVIYGYTLSSMRGNVKFPPQGDKDYLSADDILLTEADLDTLYRESADAGLTNWAGDSFALVMTNGVNQSTIEIADDDIEGMTLEEIDDLIFSLAMEEYAMLIVNEEDA